MPSLTCVRLELTESRYIIALYFKVDRGDCQIVQAGYMHNGRISYKCLRSLKKYFITFPLLFHKCLLKYIMTEGMEGINMHNPVNVRFHIGEENRGSATERRGIIYAVHNVL